MQNLEEIKIFLESTKTHHQNSFRNLYFPFVGGYLKLGVVFEEEFIDLINAKIYQLDEVRICEDFYVGVNSIEGLSKVLLITLNNLHAVTSLYTPKVK
tara:strand:+ start:1461 stop:1754 length:294 start_codon:yes stop_codon:yes gene_type:complete